MEIASVATLLVAILSKGWYFSRKVDKTAADLRGDLRDTRDELVGRIDKTAADLRKELRDTRVELRGEVRDVGDKVDHVEKRAGRYEQRMSYVEGKMGFPRGAADLGF